MSIPEDPPAGMPEWIVTFGDMMSLLLTFFIMLVSMSEIKSQDKYQAMADSMRKQFGFDLSTTSVIPGWARPRDSAIAQVATAGRARKQDTMMGGQKVRAPSGENATVRMVRPGTKTGVGTAIQFAADAAELSDENKQALQIVALELSGKPQKIEIRGHAGKRPVPPASGYDDQWGLAYARCRSTMRFLVDELQIDTQRIRIAVAGANEPIHLGSDPNKLRQNDRAEIYLLDEIVSDLSGTPEEQQQRFSEEGS